MFTKKFLLTVTCADATRFDYDEARIASELQFSAENLFRDITTGPVPAITVIQDECRCEICEASEPQPVRG